MLKRCCCVFLALLAVFLMPIASFAGESGVPSVSAQSAILINGETLEVIYEKNVRRQMSMASTTKIMTSLLALEAGNPQKVIEITEEMVRVEGTSMGLQAGDCVTLEALVAGMLLESGNDAANATAFALGGSLEGFAKMMNAKAREIGMQDTNFVTPSGLDHTDHYTTAYDMALLGAYAMNNPDFQEICSAQEMVVSFGNPAAQRKLNNHNKMLTRYEDAVGIKTGFTKKSGRCLVSAAERDGIRLISVTLNAPNDWEDTEKLFDYGFSVTQMVEIDSGERDFTLPVVGGVKEEATLTLSRAFRYPCMDASALEITSKTYVRHFAYAPVKQGDILGYVCYYNEEQLLCRVPVVAAETVEAVPVTMQPEKESLWDKILNLIKKIKELFHHGKST